MSGTYVLIEVLRIFFIIFLVIIVLLVYNIIMNKLEENYLDPFIQLKGLLSNKIQQESKKDFLTFVRMMAPSIVSDFRMGNT